jgi:hypothetical protein
MPNHRSLILLPWRSACVSATVTDFFLLFDSIIITTLLHTCQPPSWACQSSIIITTVKAAASLTASSLPLCVSLPHGLVEAGGDCLSPTLFPDIVEEPLQVLLLEHSVDSGARLPQLCLLLICIFLGAGIGPEEKQSFLMMTRLRLMVMFIAAGEKGESAVVCCKRSCSGRAMLLILVVLVLELLPVLLLAAVLVLVAAAIMIVGFFLR